MPRYTPSVNMNAVRQAVAQREALVGEFHARPEGSVERELIYQRITELDSELESYLVATNAVEQFHEDDALVRSREEGKQQTIKGLGCFLLAAIVSLVTYAAASDGGSYVVFWGAMAVAGFMILRGVMRMLNR